MSLVASCAISSVRAATAAISSRMQRTLPPSAAPPLRARWSLAKPTGCCSTRSAVMTASTPGSASAALVAMRCTRAWGYCVLRMAPWAMRGRVRSWRNCVCPVTFSAPSRFGVSLPMTLKLTAVCLSSGTPRGAWTRGGVRAGSPGYFLFETHPRHLALPPLGARHEAGAIPTQSLGLLENGLHRLLDVERLGHGLGRVPRGVDEELDPVALGIGEIDRPGVAVGDDPELIDAFVTRPRMHDLEIFEGGQLVRHLVHHVELDAGRSARGQHQLMMLVGITRQKDQIGSARELPAVAHEEAEHASVEVFHPGEVDHVKPEMAERNGR